jgi:phosphate transport system permease protein
MTAANPPVRISRLTGTRRGNRRSRTDRTMRLVAGLAAVACVVPLAAVLIFVTLNGVAALNLDLLTKPSRAQGIGGGAAAAILGSIQMVVVATVIAIPFGVLAGVYVREFASARPARAVRFAADVIVGIPSILIGIFVFTVLVLPFKQYNAFAGSVALAVIMVPVIMRTTEEILRLVPNSLREASLALGIPAWRTVLSVVVRTGLPGILTGIMLAVARAAGETAPLLFTAFAVNSTSWNLGEQMNSLPIQIFNDVRQAQSNIVERAWGAALTLVLMILVLTLLARLIQRRSAVA